MELNGYKTSICKQTPGDAVYVIGQHWTASALTTTAVVTSVVKYLHIQVFWLAIEING